MVKTGRPRNDHPPCRCCGRPGTIRGMCPTESERQRRKAIALGVWQSRWVSATAARQHLVELLDARLEPKDVAALADTDTKTILRLRDAVSDKLDRRVSEAILAIEIPDCAAEVAGPTAWVSILGAQRRFQALVAAGHQPEALARELGTHGGSGLIQALLGRTTARKATQGRMITAANDLAVRTLFDRLQMVPGVSERARRYGADRKWPLPFEWDDESIDDPATEPIHARWTEESAREERRAKVHEWTQAGMSAAEIAERLDVDKRTVERDRAWLGKPANIAKIAAA